jgi:hypothetical protein
MQRLTLLITTQFASVAVGTTGRYPQEITHTQGCFEGLSITLGGMKSRRTDTRGENVAEPTVVFETKASFRTAIRTTTGDSHFFVAVAMFQQQSFTTARHELNSPFLNWRQRV